MITAITITLIVNITAACEMTCSFKDDCSFKRHFFLELSQLQHEPEDCSPGPQQGKQA